jgi:hypothetical protein
MPLIPRSKLGRALALLWLLPCIALLIFAYVQREIHDMPVAFTWLLIMWTFPAGMVVVLPAALSARILTPLLSGAQYDPFLESLVSWLLMVPAAYAQWFVVLPTLARRWRRKREA